MQIENVRPLTPERVCEMCQHWKTETRDHFVITGGQMPIPAKIVRAQNGGMLPRGAQTLEMSMCAEGPVWIPTAPAWHCGRWKPRLSA